MVVVAIIAIAGSIIIPLLASILNSDPSETPPSLSIDPSDDPDEADPADDSTKTNEGELNKL